MADHRHGGFSVLVQHPGDLVQCRRVARFQHGGVGVEAGGGSHADQQGVVAGAFLHADFAALDLGLQLLLQILGLGIHVIAHSGPRQTAADRADQRALAAVLVIDDRAQRRAAHAADDGAFLGVAHVAGIPQIVRRTGRKQQCGQQGGQECSCTHGGGSDSLREAQVWRIRRHRA